MSNPNQNYSVTLKQMDEWKGAILSAVADAIGYGLAASDGQKLSDALKTAEAAIDGVLQSFSDAGEYINSADNQQYTYQARAQRAAQIVQTATDKAQQAVESLASVGTRLGDELAASMQMDRPSGVDSATLLDRKGDLQALLGLSAGSLDSLQQAIINRIQKAIDQGDSLSAYVLSAGPLELWYEAHGLTDAMVQNCYAIAVGSRRNPDGTAVRGAQLAALLRSGGSGGFQAYLVCCKQIIYQAQQDYEGYLGTFQAPKRPVGDILGR